MKARAVRLIPIAARIAVILTLVFICGSPVWAVRPDTRTRIDQFVAAGDVQSALAELYRAQRLSLVPTDYTIHEALADYCLDRNRLDCALILVESEADATGWNARLHGQAARILVRMSRSVQASLHWHALVSSPDAPSDLRREAWNGIGGLAVSRRDWTTLEQAATQLVLLDPNDRQGNLWRGLLTIATDPRAGSDALTRTGGDPLALRIQSGMSQLYAQVDPGSLAFEAGLVLLEAEQYGFAERALKLAISAGIQDGVAFAYLGVAQDYLGEDGSDMLGRAVAIAPNDAQVRLLEALHLRLRGQPSAALNVLNQVGSANPRDPYVALELGRTTRALGLLADAHDWFAQAVYLAPQERSFAEVQALFLLEENYELAGRGLIALTASNQRFPESGMIWTALAWAQVNSNQPNLALQSFEKAIQYSPNDPHPYFYHGLWLEQRQMPTEAILSMRQALTIAERSDSYRVTADLIRRALNRLGDKPTFDELLNAGTPVPTP